MDHLHHLAIVYGAYIIATASPGPSNMAIMAVAMQRGRKAGLSIAAGIVTGFVLIVIFIVGDRSILDHHIGGVQECGLFGADVHEGGLNAGEHGFDLPEVHVANPATGIGPIHQQLHQLAVLENGDARLARRRVHQDFSLHSDVPRAPAVATPLDRCGDEHGDRTEAARARQAAATRTTSRGSPNQHD